MGTTQFPGGLVRLAVTSGLIIVLSACGGALASIVPTAGSAATPTAGSTAPGETPVGSSGPAPATSSPAPEFASSTVSATAAPVGAIMVEMAGAPPHFVPRTVSATAGDIVFFLDNTSLQGTHALAFDRSSLVFVAGRVTNVPLAVSDPVRYRAAATFTVQGLPAGTYFIWCNIENHAAEGMTGTLTVSQ